MENNLKSFFDRPFIKGVSFFVAIAGLCWIIYAEYFKEKAPRYEYEIISKVSLFDNVEDIAFLKVFVDSIDIKESGYNIHIFTIKISNQGSNVITPNSYDEGNFGLKINGGCVIESPQIIDASSAHIRERFGEKYARADSSFIFMPRLTLEKSDFYIVKFAVLHKRGDVPAFETKGKIIEQKLIEIFDRSHSDNPNNITIWKGSWWVQIVRGVTYTLAFIIILVVIAGILTSISNFFSKTRRRKFIKNNFPKNILDESVKSQYIENGESWIETISKYLTAKDNVLTEQYKKSKEYIDSNDNKTANNFEHKRFHTRRLDEFEHYRRGGFISIDDTGNISINKAKRNSVKQLYKILKDRGIIRGLKEMDSSFIFDERINRIPLEK